MLAPYFTAILISAFLFVGGLSVPDNALAAESVDELYALAQESLDREDAMTAMSYLRQASELGHSPSQARLAWLLDGADINEEAAHWYRLAAESGDPEGQYGLATMYSKGEGVERDPEEFVKWVTLAAEQSYGPAMSAMANMYEQGLYARPQDTELAIKWIQRGVALDQVWALARMEKAYRFGELGLSPDLDKAEQYAQERQRPVSD